MEETKDRAKSEESQKPKNLAYKAIFLADGIGFLFEEILPFSANGVQIGTDDEDRVFIALGENLILITSNIMRFLEKHRTFFLYRSPLESYDPESIPIAFEMEKDAMTRLKKLWESVNQVKR